MLNCRSLLKCSTPIIVQNAGAHRKPRWLPVARSKIFRIPKRPVVPEEEKIELARINKNYKTQMRAIRRYFYEEILKDEQTVASATSEMSLKIEAEEWERCVALNDKWNAERAQEREVRRKQEVAKMEEDALNLMAQRDEEIKRRVERATEEIKRIKEISKTFVTPENLDEAIETALNNPVDYNFAIDLKGNQTLGRNTKITRPQKAA